MLRFANNMRLVNVVALKQGDQPRDAGILLVREREYFIWDEELPGFGLRILPADPAQWSQAIRYTIPRRARVMGVRFVQIRSATAWTKALTSCPVLDGQRLSHCNMELAGSVLNAE